MTFKWYAGTVISTAEHSPGSLVLSEISGLLITSTTSELCYTTLRFDTTPSGISNQLTLSFVCSWQRIHLLGLKTTTDITAVTLDRQDNYFTVQEVYCCVPDNVGGWILALQVQDSKKRNWPAVSLSVHTQVTFSAVQPARIINKIEEETLGHTIIYFILEHFYKNMSDLIQQASLGFCRSVCCQTAAHSGGRGEFVSADL